MVSQVHASQSQCGIRMYSFLRSTLIQRLSGPIVGLIFYFLFIFIGEDHLMSIIIGIAAGFVGFQITSVIRDEEIILFMKNRSAATHLGTSYGIPDLLADDLRKAINVRNTFITAPGYASSEKFESEAARFYDLVLKDGHWTDIINDVVLNNPTARFSKFNSNKRYTARVIKNCHFAIPCFILCSTSSETSVFFGWSYKKDKEKSHIFYSVNPEMVNLFERYWSTLESDSVSEEIKDLSKLCGRKDGLLS